MLFLTRAAVTAILNFGNHDGGRRPALEKRVTQEAALSVRGLGPLTEKLGLSFKNTSLLQEALVHRSYLNEHPGFALPSNERLEFLGDALLGLIIAEHLFAQRPHRPEGELTALRAAVVNRTTLAQVAARLGLGEHLLVGRGTLRSGGRAQPTLVASAFEAVVGALYVDCGLEATRAAILRLLRPELERLEEAPSIKDFKSWLQEVMQETQKLAPTYHVVAAEGPHHARTFWVEVWAGEMVLGKGSGPSKRRAEQEAARTALLALGLLKAPALPETGGSLAS